MTSNESKESGDKRSFRFSLSSEERKRLKTGVNKIIALKKSQLQRLKYFEIFRDNWLVRIFKVFVSYCSLRKFINWIIVSLCLPLTEPRIQPYIQRCSRQSKSKICQTMVEQNQSISLSLRRHLKKPDQTSLKNLKLHTKSKAALINCCEFWLIDRVLQWNKIEKSERK